MDYIEIPETIREEDTEQYMQHEHFEDIRLPDRDTPVPRYDQEDQLSIRDLFEFEFADGYDDIGLN